jgi:hypothetical protein
MNFPFKTIECSFSYFYIFVFLIDALRVQVALRKLHALNRLESCAVHASSLKKRNKYKLKVYLRCCDERVVRIDFSSFFPATPAFGSWLASISVSLGNCLSEEFRD